MIYSSSPFTWICLKKDSPDQHNLYSFQALSDENPFFPRKAGYEHWGPHRPISAFNTPETQQACARALGLEDTGMSLLELMVAPAEANSLFWQNGAYLFCWSPQLGSVLISTPVDPWTSKGLKPLLGSGLLVISDPDTRPDWDARSSSAFNAQLTQRVLDAKLQVESPHLWKAYIATEAFFEPPILSGTMVAALRASAPRRAGKTSALAALAASQAQSRHAVHAPMKAVAVKPSLAKASLFGSRYGTGSSKIAGASEARSQKSTGRMPLPLLGPKLRTRILSDSYEAWARESAGPLSLAAIGHKIQTRIWQYKVYQDVMQHTNLTSMTLWPNKDTDHKPRGNTTDFIIPTFDKEKFTGELTVSTMKSRKAHENVEIKVDFEAQSFKDVLE